MLSYISLKVYTNFGTLPLFSELSFVLDVPKENMVQFIEDMIKADLL